MFETLRQVPDQRSGAVNCSYNGSIQEYLESTTLEEPLRDLFGQLSETMDESYVMVDYRFDVHHELISNQIIRYKDVQKLPEHSFLLPFLVYALKGDALYTLILVEGESVAYMISKGLFLAITEQGGLLESLKNQCVAANTNHPLLLEAWHRFSMGQKAGAVQRYLDQAIFSSYEGLQEQLQAMSAQLQEDVKARLKDNGERALVIYDAVVQWFLFKKVAYVHTMMNRNLLLRECEGDIKKQRHQAKLNADKIQFLMYSEMWRA